MATKPEQSEAIDTPKEAVKKNDNQEDLAEIKTSSRKQMGLFKKILNPSVFFTKSGSNPYVNEGYFLLKKNKPEDAIQAFNAALSEDKLCLEAYLGIGKSYVLMGGVDNTKKSIQYFNAALKVDSTRLDIYNDTIDAYERLGDKRNAAMERKKRFIAKTIKSSPNDPKANNNMGVIQLQQKNVDAAIKSFGKALTVNKNFHIARRNLASAYLYKAKLMDSRSEKQMLIKQSMNLIDQVLLNDKSAESLLIKTKVLLEGGKPKEALTTCNAVLAQDPSMKEAYNTKRAIEESLGNVGNASRAYESYQSLKRQEQKNIKKKFTSPFD